jgi:presequence protease
MKTPSSYQEVQRKRLEEIKADGVRYTHSSGANILSLQNSDENKVFCVAFKTPALDSTGLPHILEHSVLCGSKRYPLKKPFVEMLKSSLHTFLNAMTYADRTIYPVASTNEQDYFNLMQVYLDSVFHPLLDESTFLQEGWHYALDADGKLSRSGVVFNEMKGVYSDPLSRLSRTALQSVFPDTWYANDSGGDPSCIPDLTYQQFLDYHQKYYHPSNALILFYGDANHEKELEVLDEWLRSFPTATASQNPPLQTLRSLKTQATVFIDPPEDYSQDSGSAAHLVQVTWLLPHITDIKEHLTLSILDYLLTGSTAAPLYKALIDSGMGDAVLGGGFGSHLQQTYFTMGLKNIAEKNIPEVRGLLVSTLEELVTNGVDAELIESGINAIEFSLRENNTGGYPRGLVAITTALSSWVYGEDPMEAISYDAPFQQIKLAIKNGERIFEDVISRYLLNNDHWTETVGVPKQGHTETANKLEQEQVEHIATQLTASEREEIKEKEALLEAAQNKEDSAEAIASLPTLSISDLDRSIRTIPSRQNDANGSSVHVHELDTNKIAYVTLGFPIKAIPIDLQPLFPLFCAALTELGTEKEDFVKLSQRIDRETGGVSASVASFTKQNQLNTEPYLFIGGKAVTDKVPALLSIINDMSRTVRFENKERFTQLLRQRKAGLESSIVPGGHRYAMARLRAMNNQEGVLSELWSGISQIHYLRKLESLVDTAWHEVEQQLRTIAALVFCNSNTLANITVDEDAALAVEAEVSACIEGFPDSIAPIVDIPLHIKQQNEGYTIPTQVHFVTTTLDLTSVGFLPHGSVNVITNLLNTEYLWQKVRMEGGAYGASGGYNRFNGIMSYSSFRDPHLTKTLSAFDAAGEWLQKTTFTEQQIERSIIGTIGSIDSYQLPDAKGATAFSRSLLAVTDTERQRIRDEIFSTTPEHFREFGRALSESRPSRRLAAMGSEQSIADSSALFDVVASIL